MVVQDMAQAAGFRYHQFTHALAPSSCIFQQPLPERKYWVQGHSRNFTHLNLEFNVTLPFSSAQMPLVQGFPANFFWQFLCHCQHFYTSRSSVFEFNALMLSSVLFRARDNGVRKGRSFLSELFWPDLKRGKGREPGKWVHTLVILAATCYLLTVSSSRTDACLLMKSLCGSNTCCKCIL